MTALQEATPSDYQARVVGLLESSLAAMPGVGYLIGGILTPPGRRARPTPWRASARSCSSCRADRAARPAARPPVTGAVEDADGRRSRRSSTRRRTRRDLSLDDQRAVSRVPLDHVALTVSRPRTVRRVLRRALRPHRAGPRRRAPADPRRRPRARCSRSRRETRRRTPSPAPTTSASASHAPTTSSPPASASGRRRHRDRVAGVRPDAGAGRRPRRLPRRGLRVLSAAVLPAFRRPARAATTTSAPRCPR